MPSIDVEVDDFLWSCSDRDIQKLIGYLIKDGYINEEDILENQTELDEHLIKIQNAQIQLTTEEEEIIKQIANRLV